MSHLHPAPLAHVHVQDAMHAGLLCTESGTPLTEVARIMADHRVHAVVVEGDEAGGAPAGIVTSLDVMAAVASAEELTAGDVAATETVTIATNDRLDHAAQLMAEHGVTHLIVVDTATGHPVGVLSTIDIAVVYAA